ncbi:MAG: ArsA family ATPase [Deltaproteobacteria bacterium]|nr:ArsA family ATPase [Deltaproteobacteria bacterium]
MNSSDSSSQHSGNRLAELSTAGLDQIVAQKRILITVGAGGVGKTTTAAAIGLLGARQGRRTLTMTIDPARRLATSLGLQDGLDNVPRQMPAQKAQQAGISAELFSAMMLDPKRTFDELIEREAPSAEGVTRVMANKLYREISTRLAGGQEYAAMEKLHELATSDAYDLLILDTPPTANAIDFFDAPQKMINAIDSPTVQLFLDTYNTGGRFSLGLLGGPARLIFRRIARFVGGGFLDDVAVFFAEIQAMLAGFRERATRVAELLTQDDVGVIIVTSPQQRAIDEAVQLHQRLLESRLRSLAVVVNRVHGCSELTVADHAALSSSSAPTAEQLEHALTAVPTDQRPTIAAGLLAAHEKLCQLSANDQRRIDELRQRCGHEIVYVRVPFFKEDIFDVSGLMQAVQYLSGSAQALR